MQFTAKIVAQSANRALGLLIAKSKSIEGFPIQAFTKQFESTVVPVILYEASIWGNDDYSCINAVQHREARFFS